MQKILIATTNKGKFKELMEVLGDLPFKFVSLTDEGITGDVEETGKTYEENALLKAAHFGQIANLPTIADDSGIHIDALEGELGVKTRRWGAGEKATDEEWLDFFLKRMASEKNRRAEFVSAIALWHPKTAPLIFRGECTGVILSEPQVELEHGIPLSAVFLADGQTKVFSALSKDEKNAISHRGKAIKKCAEHLMRHGV